jgi:dTDP-4-amino-4,6-dideoxygalactose transaminase
MGQPAAEMYGNRRAWTYDVREVGFRYHLANLHAAIGLAQLAKLPRIGAARRDWCRLYNEQLGGIDHVRTPGTDFHDMIPFLYYVRVPSGLRDGLRGHLRALGIDTGIHWQPGHSFTLLRGCRRGDLAVTDRVANEVLTLPLHSDFSSETVERVAAGVTTYFDELD